MMTKKVSKHVAVQIQQRHSCNIFRYDINCVSVGYNNEYYILHGTCFKIKKCIFTYNICTLVGFIYERRLWPLQVSAVTSTKTQ